MKDEVMLRSRWIGNEVAWTGGWMDGWGGEGCDEVMELREVKDGGQTVTCSCSFIDCTFLPLQLLSVKIKIKDEHSLSFTTSRCRSRHQILITLLFYLDTNVSGA